MSREAFGDPPESQEPPDLCPVCGNDWHAEDCEFGKEVARRLKAERATGIRRQEGASVAKKFPTASARQRVIAALASEAGDPGLVKRSRCLS